MEPNKKKKSNSRKLQTPEGLFQQLARQGITVLSRRYASSDDPSTPKQTQATDSAHCARHMPLHAQCNAPHLRRGPNALMNPRFQHAVLLLYALSPTRSSSAASPSAHPSAEVGDMRKEDPRVECVYMLNKEAKSSQGTATHDTERAN